MTALPTPGRYRKRPVEVEAMHVTEDTMHQVAAWCWGKAQVRRVPGPGRSLVKAIVIHTLEGDMRAQPGDWVIRGVAGEFYPCAPDIFEQTYEPVAD